MCEELHNLYSSSNIIRTMKVKKSDMNGTCSTHREMRNTYIILVRMSEWKIPLGRCRLCWKDDIKMDLKEIGWEVWTGFIRLRIGTVGGLFRTVIYFRVKGGEFLD
jgi:hypothetical protein